MSVPWLSFVIQVPAFAVLLWLFARGRPRRVWLPAGAGALLLSLAATLAGFAAADTGHGPMWPQVLAALAGYGAFLAALGLAWWLPARYRQ